jgi:hypothetical protein
MRSCLPEYSRYLCLGAFLVLLILAAGCSTPQLPTGSAASSTPATFSGVTVTKPDTTHITVAYVGPDDMTSLLELEVTLTDDQGRSLTRSIGSKLSTTPIQLHATHTFTGAYAGKNHVVITGYYTDGTQKTIVNQDF